MMTSRSWLRKRGIVAVAALGLAAFSLAACGDDDGGSADSSTVKLGFMGDLTGENKQLGININNGAKLAIDQYNATNPDDQDRADRLRHPGRPDPGDQRRAQGRLRRRRRRDRAGLLRRVEAGGARSRGERHPEHLGLRHERRPEQERLEDLAPRARQRRCPGSGRGRLHVRHAQGQEGRRHRRPERVRQGSGRRGRTPS